MKKITLLIFLLITSIGYSQVIEDFEGTAPTTNVFDGLTSSTVVANPTVPSEKSLELITSTTSAGWQGGGLLFQGGNGLDLSTADKEVTIAVYSLVATDILAKVSAGGGPVSAADATHTGNGWETLTFDFAIGKDGTGTANGIYTNMIFYPAWNNLGGTCINGCYSGSTSNSAPAMTIYIDDISGIVSTPPETCSDGIQNQDETGIDCGGATCDACAPEPSGAAPVPTTGNASVYSFYNDTNGYTTNFPFVYSFGAASDVDLDATAAVNNALKVNLNADGYGAGEGGPDDVSSYDFLNFNYWYTHTRGTAGFVMIMIDNDGAVQEFKYQIGSIGASDQADIVSETWTQVSIPMSHFTGLGFDATKLFQWKVDKYNQSGDNGGELYLDNIVFTKDFPLSNDSFSLVETTVYPNPSSSDWNIKTSNAVITSVEVFNLLGKSVISRTNNSTDIAISTEGLTSGIYLARVTTDLGTKTIKLIKE